MSLVVLWGLYILRSPGLLFRRHLQSCWGPPSKIHFPLRLCFCSLTSFCVARFARLLSHHHSVPQGHFPPDFLIMFLDNSCSTSWSSTNSTAHSHMLRNLNWIGGSQEGHLKIRILFPYSSALQWTSLLASKAVLSRLRQQLDSQKPDRWGWELTLLKDVL